MASSKTVNEYIDRHEERRSELEKLRSIANTLPYKECVKWGMPTYTINGKNVVSLGSFTNWSCLWFHQGAFLKDKAGVLENAQEGKTKGMRQWRFSDVTAINEKLVKEYLLEAIDNQKAGKEIKPAKKASKKVEMPTILRGYLDSNLDHLKTFEKLTLSQQNEFSNYLIEAKREKTKLDRLEKIKDLLEEGKTLNTLWQR